MDTDTAADSIREATAAHEALCAATAHLFDVVIAAQESQANLPEYQDVAVWLRWTLGVSGRTARQWVRMANALQLLPEIRRAFSQGTIAVDRLRLLLRVATPDTEGDLVALAATLDLEDLRREVNDIETAQAEAEQPTEALPPTALLRTWWRHDTLHGNFTVPGADGVLVETALRRLGALAPRDPHSGLYRDPQTREGEALIQMASESLTHDGDHNRATLIVHTTAQDLISQTGTGWDAARRVFDTTDLQLLACDARLQPAIDDPNGITVGVGRTTRRIPPWLRHLLEGRDQGCRFPGCDRTRWLHAHHLLEWIADDGPTNLDNLLALCGFHHRLIHREHWSIDGNPNHNVVFRNQAGHIHTPIHHRFPPTHTQHLLDGIQHMANHQHTQLATAATHAGPSP